MGSALRPSDGVYLVQDHGLDATERLPRLRGEEQKEGFGRRDQDVGRRAKHPAAILRRRVSCAYADRERRAESRERTAQIALDVVVERLERGDVEQAEPVTRPLVQPVDPEEEGRERLPGPSGCLNEDMPARRYRGPAESLRRGRSVERAREPLPRLRREDVERVHRSESTVGGSGFGHATTGTVYTQAVPVALYLTESNEANELIAREPLALLIGFALDQQVTVPTAFVGPYKLKSRIGGLDAAAIAAMDPLKLEEVFRERPAIHRFPGSMARRVQELCAVVADEYDGQAERVWTEATDAADLRRRIGALPGFGQMKITGLGSVLGAPFRPRDRSGAGAESPLPGWDRLPCGARRVPGR